MVHIGSSRVLPIADLPIPEVAICRALTLAHGYQVFQQS